MWLHTSHDLLVEGFTGSALAPNITIDSHLWEGGSNNPWGTTLEPCSITLGMPKPEVGFSCLGPRESWAGLSHPCLA